MNTRRNGPRRALLALAVVAGLGSAAWLRAAPLPAGDEGLRKRALSLNEVTGASTIQGQVQALLDDPAGTKKLLGVASKMAKQKPQPFNVNATYILANAADKLKDADAGEAFYRLYAEQSLKLLSGQGVSVGYQNLIRLLYRNKKYAETEKLCREFLEIEGDESIDRLKPEVLERMILAMAKQGQTDQAVEILDRMIKRQPDNWLTMEMKGQVLREAGKLDEAVKVLEDVGERIRNDKRLKKEQQDLFLDDVRYSLSGLYVDLAQVDKAAEQLKALLAHDPDNPTYNNDLGYIWADHDMNLAESEKLIRKALEEDRKQQRKNNPDLKPEEEKDNAAYLDSLAWVLFKQKKYQEAKPLLEQAVKEEEGKHIEIFDHLGEVYQALGEKAQAVTAWKKGLQVAGPGKREQQRKVAVEKKLKANQ
jgi:tetratricopeptide (TPR) repeat protein